MQSLSQITAAVESRWQCPMPHLLVDFATQGLSRRQTALALGISKTALASLVSRHTVDHHFTRRAPRKAVDNKAWIARVEAEAGQPIDAVLRQEAAAAALNGTTMASLAAEFDVPVHRVQALCAILGIRWPKGRPVTVE